MKDKQFDHIIHAKLSSLRASDIQSDWEVLQSKIDSDLQSEAEFDSSISDKLTQLSTAGISSIPDWETFAQKLHQTEEFDLRVKQKLNNIPATKVSEHWLLLQERLQKIRDLKESILKLKFGESLLMMSLLLCFVGLSQYWLSPDLPTDYKHVALLSQSERGESMLVKPNNASKDTKQSPIVEQDISSLNSNDQVTSTQVAVRHLPLHTQSPQVTQSRSGVTDTSLSTTGRSQMVSLVSNSDSRQISDNAAFNAKESNTSNTYIHTKSDDGLDNTIQSSTIPLLASQGQSSSSSIDRIDRNLQSISSTAVDMSSTYANRMSIIKDQSETKSTPGRFAIHTIAGVGIDQINTPGDEVFEFSGYQHYASNSDVGLRLSYDIKDWSIETGISLLHKGYKPKYIQDTIRVQNQAVVQSLESIDLEFVSVPLTIKRSIPIRENLSIYGMMGIEYLYVSSEQYNVEEKSTAIGEVGQDLEVVGIIEYKENARVVNDHSMNYTAGLGLIKSINPLVDIYGQALYRGQFNSTTGIGLNEDRFNSLTLQAGFKLRLSSKN